MSGRLPLDVASFEELLAAAWVLQCQHDEEEKHQQKIAMMVEDLPVYHELPRPAALALVDNLFSAPAILPATPPRAWTRPHIRLLIPADSKRQLRTATSSAGPACILLIIVSLLMSEVWRDKSLHGVAEAAPHTEASLVPDALQPDQAGQPEVQAVTASTQTELRAAGPSHLQITDPAIGSVVEALSRFEIKTLQRQARFGDDEAALTLGMAFETGRHVRQNCAQAARWIRMAAEGGNAAAQYNLALRYLYGDGVPANPDEARKWLESAAARGYPRAKSSKLAEQWQPRHEGD